MAKRSWSFMLVDIVPYVRTTQRQKFADPRYGRYRRWKEYVRTVANTYDVPAELKRSSTYSVHALVRWRGAPRADLDNVVKGLLDSLWKQDRQVYEINAHHERDTKQDSILVTVEEL